LRRMGMRPDEAGRREERSGVARDFLFIPVLKGRNRQVLQEMGHLLIGQSRPINAGGGSDTFDGGGMAQLRQTFRGQSFEGLPLGPELVQLRDQAEHFRAYEGLNRRVFGNHLHYRIHSYPFKQLPSRSAV
jgi:hypothetical protein